jgi:proteic killer suppression protein
VITRVVIVKQARKALRSVPRQVAAKFRISVVSVETVGLEQVRKVPGYHDAPLRGPLVGMRSIRLNDAHRAYYRVEGDTAKLVRVTGVDKHLYGG